MRTIVAIMLAAGTAAAQPAIRPYVGGYVFLGTDHARLIEAGTLRQPGTEPCPFLPVAPFASSSAGELALFDPTTGQTFCSWTLDVWASQGQAVSVQLLGEPTTDLMAFTGTDFTAAYHVALNPCDIDLSGWLNVLDFMAFLNRPYDWNGDGLANVADFTALLNGCGGD